MRALINSMVADVSRKHDLGAEAVEGIRYVAREVDWTRFSRLPRLGIDEIALRKGHRDFMVIVTNRNADRQIALLLAVLADRCKETVQAFLTFQQQDRGAKAALLHRIFNLSHLFQRLHLKGYRLFEYA